MRVLTRACFVTAVFALVAQALLTGGELRGLRARLVSVQGSLGAQREIGLLVQMIDQAERAQDTFEKTSGEEALAECIRSLEGIDNQATRLSGMISSGPDQAGRIAKVRRAVSLRASSVQRAYRKSLRGTDATPLKSSRAPFGLRTTIPALLLAENERLESECLAVEASLRSAWLYFAIPTTFALLLLGVGHASARVDNAAIARAERERSLTLARTESARLEAESASRAKDRFLAMLSHELRVPLTPVLMAVSSSQESGDRLPDGPMWEMVRRNVALQARMIDDLLDVARVSHDALHLDLDVVDVHEVLRRGIEICRKDILEAGLRVTLDLGAPDHHVRADEVRLIQVFWNLIKNAAKFTEKGGELTIRSWNQALSPSGEDQRRVALEFRDSGQGITAEDLPKIFDPFERGGNSAKRRTVGLGLGLAISQGIVLRHGGKLSATSDGPGKGASFLVELSTVTAPGEVHRRMSLGRPLATEAARRARILLVDDNRDTLEYANLVLRRAGHVVEKAASIAEARSLLASCSFDLMISDIELLDGTGFDLMREVGGRFPAIALSGFGSDDDLKMSEHAGFAAHLTKPVDARTLQSAIAEVTHAWSATRSE